MLKKLIVCAFALTFILTAFASCKVKKDESNNLSSSDQNSSNQNASDQADNSQAVSVVYPEGLSDAYVAEEIWRSVLYSFDTITKFNSDAEEQAAREIVIGNTNRRISSKASELLEIEREANNCEYPMFLIYSDGNSLACVFDDNAEARSMLLEYLSENRIPENLFKHSKGVLYVNDIISVQEAKDEVTVSKAWSAIEEKVGSEITKELKALYSLYTDDIISWFANLYEPYVCVCDGECKNTQYCGGGGYYYSNSGRNTPGYLPDIESTHQALGWISASGMTGGAHYNTVIPDWMEKQIVRFIKSRQDPNGYFYHPQWSKDAINNNTSRRTRDLQWALSTLEGFGAFPTYDINGVKGDGILYDGTPLSDIAATSSVHLIEKLIASKAVGVSKIISVDATLPSYLVDADGMRAYLSGLDITEKSYHIGNELAGVAEEVVWRDVQLKEQGKEPLADILINWLNLKQNPITGLWSDKTDYYSVNGFFKITFVYNGLGYPIPNVEKGLSASIDAIMSEASPDAVTDVYNTWYNVLNVIENIQNYYKAGNESVDAALEVLYSKAGAAIAKTREKLVLFLKNDGSFSYNQKTTSATSQGMPVAIPGTNEGDINATVIATTGTANRILAVLGFDESQRIPMYTRADLLKYLHILEKLGPVIKDEEPKPEKITFKDDVIGQLPEDAECEYSADSFKGGYYPANNGFEVIKDTTADSKRGKIFKIESVKGLYNSVKFEVPGSNFSGQCFAFEADMCIPSSSLDYAVRLRMDDCYAIAFKMYDGKVNLWDVSTTGTVIEQTDLDIGIPFGQWFNLKVEYYKGEHGSVRIKTYIDGILMAVSDNYYDQYGKKITQGNGTPSSTYSYVSLSTMAGLNTTILLDNVLCYKNSQAYEAYTSLDRPLTVNVDAPDPGEKIYTFDDCEGQNSFPDGFVVSGSGVTVNGDTDKTLNISAQSAGSVIEIPANNRVYGANCFVTEMDIAPHTLSAGSKLRLELVGKKDPTVKLAIFDLVVIEQNGEKHLALADAHAGVTSTVLHSLLIPCNAENKLRLEHYDNENITIVYINGTAITASAIAVKGSQKPGFGALRISNIGSSETVLEIDNLKIESVIKELKVEKYDNEKLFDFDTGSYDEVALEGASVVGGSDKSVILYATEGSVKFPATIRSPLVTVTRFDADVSFSGSGEYSVSFGDKNGNPIAVLYMNVKDGNVSIYECTESGKSETPLAEFDVDGSFSLTLEWYKNEQMIAVLKDDKLMALTSMYYSEETVNEWAESFKISASGGNGSIDIDNVRCESLYEIFVLPDDFDSENTESGAEKITFETTGSVAMLPSAITYNLSSPGASFKIEQLIRDEKLTRVISMTSNVGGNDAVRIGLTKKIPGANCVTFEADMYIDYDDSATWRNMQFWIQTKDGNSSAYMFEIWDSSLFSENGGSTNVAKGFTGVRTWFTLKVEYYDGGYVIVYSNGKPIYTGDGYRGKADGASPISAGDIERINLYPYGDFAVTYKLDNISLIQEVKTYVAPEIEKEPESELGKVEDVLTFEDGLLNEATDFASGSINGTTAKIEEESDGNHVLVFTTPASSSVNNIIKVNYTKADADLSNGIAFEFDVNITYTKSDDYLYIQLRDKNGASAAFISIENNSIVVYSSGSSYEFGSIKLTKGEMSQVKVEYGDTDNGVFIRISVNGSVSYEKDAYLSRDGKSISSADISYIELSTWRQITAKMDDITFYRAALTPPEKKEPEAEEKLPEVYDFESGELPSSMTLLTDNTSCVVEEDTDRGKYLNFTTAANTWGTGFYVPVLSDEDGANCIAFEADMSLNVLSGAGLRFQFMNEGGGYNMWFEIQKNGSNLYFLLYTKSSSNCYASSDAIAVNGNDNWFNLRVEYYEGDRDSVRTKVYVNEILVFVSDMFMSSGNCGCSSHGPSVTPATVSNTAKIRIRNDYSAYSGTLYIDNIKFERIVKECEDDAITAQRP